MGDKSGIEWTDATWNCLIGCSKCSPGCDHCYAIQTVGRGEAMGTEQHVGLTVKLPDGTRDWTGEVREVPHLLDQPLRWRRPRRVFVNSLSDVFHPDVTDEFIAKMFAVMALAPQHTFQLLTKRPQRMAALLNGDFWGSYDYGVGRFMQELSPERNEADALARHQLLEDAWVHGLPNVWLGTSIENDRYSFRADHLRATPAAVRWISAEPLLGPLPSLDLTGIGWVVVGGESKAGARPMHPDWARDIRDRCRAHTITCPNDTNGDGDCAMCARPRINGTIPVGRHPRPIPFHFKQWGEWCPTDSDHKIHMVSRNRASHEVVSFTPDGRLYDGKDSDLWLECTTMARFGKRATGRELDGVEHDGSPA